MKPMIRTVRGVGSFSCARDVDPHALRVRANRVQRFRVSSEKRRVEMHDYSKHMTFVVGGAQA